MHPHLRCAAAVLELGALTGALMAGVFADRYSRRQSIFSACRKRLHLLAWLSLISALVVFCIGSAFQFGAQSTTHLILGRGIGGIGVGALRRVWLTLVSRFLSDCGCAACCLPFIWPRSARPKSVAP